jgi:hypothetical protein
MCHIEIKALKNLISEKERNEDTIKIDFEFRVQRLREDLAEEREFTVFAGENALLPLLEFK